jgi:hypothetical protein
MTNKKLASAIVSTLIITSLAATPALAASVTPTSTTTTANSSVRLSFTDVSSDYWGVRHISKLALEGIIEGVGDGVFAPETAVSQQDVLIMAIRMMGLQSDALANKSETVFAGFMKVSDYARNYVSLALEKGLISNEEELQRSSSLKPGEIWGQKAATREWVAEVVIRAIGKASMASSLASTSTTFSDNNQISSGTLGFVNAAVALKIVDGFEDGSFQPKGAVTRAQMATFLSRSQKELVTLPEHAVRGYLTSLTSGSISMMDKDGNTSTYKLSVNTKFYGKLNDIAISSKELQETYEISIVQVNGTAYYVEILNDELQMEVHEGQLLKLNMSTLRASLDDYDVYDLAPDVAVTDSEGRGLSLGDIVTGSTIQIRKSKLVDSDKFTSIVVIQTPVNKTATGDLQLLDKDTMQMTFVDPTSGESETYGFSSNLDATLADSSLINLNAIHVGDTVEYTVKNSEVTKIVVTKQADVGTTVDGTFKQLIDDQSTILINKTSSEPAVYVLSDNPHVVINGLANASIYDLAAGDVLKLEVYNNKVTTITVTNRSIENTYFAKIVNYSEASKILTVTDNAGKADAYTLSDAVSILYAGSKLPITNFNSFFTAGKYVDLIVSNKTVKQIQLSSQLDGVLTQVNAVNNDITLKTDSGQSITFKMNFSPTVEIANKSTSTMADLKVGDKVSLFLSFDQTIVTKIVANKTELYKTLLTTSNLKQATLMDSTNTNYTISLDGIPIFKADGSTATFADVAIDDYVKLIYKGLVITKAELVTPVRGKVTAVNAASSSLTVQDFTGKSQVINAGSNFSVKLNGGSDLSFSSIKVGDRVQVMKDASDKWLIQVAVTSKRTFDQYSTTLNQLYLKAGIAGDPTSYTVFPRVYLHTGSTILQLSSFVSDDQLNLYVLDNKVVEIEK